MENKKIGIVIQKGDSVYIYDEKGFQIGSNIYGRLHGYTLSTVTVIVDNTLNTYDAMGRKLYSNPFI